MASLQRWRVDVKRFSGSSPARAALVALVALGWSLGGCGGSSASTDAAATATGAGGRSDGAATDATTATAGRRGTGGAIITGAGGTAGARAAGGSSGLANIGVACVADADCGAGLTCLTASGKVIIGAEGPANGYCSKSCNTDGDCGASALCLDVSATGSPMATYCFQTCTFGGSASKCHSRTDVGCLTIDATTTPTTDICFPVCSQDRDCPTGRVCDLAEGLCADTPTPGDPLGTHCTVAADGGTDSCAGFCLPISAGTATTSTRVASFCSILCVVGSLDACNWAAAGASLTSGGSHGVCAIAGQNAQVGDIGFCTQECDTAANCSDQSDPGVTCDTSLMSTIGHGTCNWGG